MSGIKAPACPACGHPEAATFQHVCQLPLLLFPVPEGVRHEIKSADLTAYQCHACWHIFTPPLSDEDTRLIYEVYYEYYPFDNLETMVPVYRKPFDDLFHRVIQQVKANRPSTLLEIGCASQQQLEGFQRYGLVASGVDPSKRDSTADSRIFAGIYERLDLGSRFDVIVARFVAEHVNSLDSFLEKVRADLNDGGLFFVQVPNVAEFASNGMPFFLAHEHPQYFNQLSLDTAMARHGFRKVDLVHRQSMSLVGAYRKSVESSLCDPVDDGLPELFSQYERRTMELSAQMRAFFSRREADVVFYGAGLPLCWLLYTLDERISQTPALAIDDNDRVHGYYMPRTQVRIDSHQALRDTIPGAVLCTLNPVYHSQVVERIRSIGYTGEVFLLNRNGLHDDQSVPMYVPPSL